jgi:biopolymer transport protein TolQ
MSADTSFLTYFFDSSPIIKTVIMLLLLASVMSWTFIFQRAIFLKRAKVAMANFEDMFWSGTDLNRLYTELSHKRDTVEGMPAIFIAGFKEFIRLRKQPGIQPTMILEGAQRAMSIARSRELDKLEQHLSFLATVGSTSPYVGLFGTVWGIMTAFHALGNVQQATISMVAPGISEALITTAMGLFAAIPAVIAYNRFANEVERLLNQYDTFQEEFSSILYRQTHAVSQHINPTITTAGVSA